MQGGTLQEEAVADLQDPDLQIKRQKKQVEEASPSGAGRFAPVKFSCGLRIGSRGGGPN